MTEKSHNGDNSLTICVIKQQNLGVLWTFNLVIVNCVVLHHNSLTKDEIKTQNITTHTYPLPIIIIKLIAHRYHHP